MKKIIRNTIGFFLLSLLLCSSHCAVEDAITARIKNESGKPMVIKSFRDKIIQKTINLKNGEEHNKTFIFYMGTIPGRYHGIGLFTNGIPIDSITIVFDNKKRIIWTDDVEDVNHSYEDDYLYNLYDQNTHTYKFTIQDYNNATNCEGNCE